MHASGSRPPERLVDLLVHLIARGADAREATVAQDGELVGATRAAPPLLEQSAQALEPATARRDIGMSREISAIACVLRSAHDCSPCKSATEPLHANATYCFRPRRIIADVVTSFITGSDRLGHGGSADFGDFRESGGAEELRARR